MADFADGSWSPWLRLRRRQLAGSLRAFSLVGTCKLGNGSVVAGATVYLHDWPTMVPVGLPTTSDAAGNFSFNPPTNGTYKCTFHLAGAPNLFGITDVLVPS